MKTYSTVIAAGLLTLMAIPAMAGDRGDRANQRLDARGQHINDHLDARGDRINQHLDARGERVNERVDGPARRPRPTAA